jgi:hypothetical protein
VFAVGWFNLRAGAGMREKTSCDVIGQRCSHKLPRMLITSFHKYWFYIRLIISRASLFVISIYEFTVCYLPESNAVTSCNNVV